MNHRLACRAMVAGCITAVAVSFGGSTVAGAEEGAHGGHKHGAHRHKEFQDLKNPVEPTPQNLAAGMDAFKLHCAGCHGEDGKGTPAGRSLDPPAANLAAGQWKHGSTDGELFHLITNGSRGTAMPAWKATLSDENRWTLVNFIKSLSKAAPVYTCPMHEDVRSSSPGTCSKCGMNLEPVKTGLAKPAVDGKAPEVDAGPGDHGKHHH